MNSTQKSLLTIGLSVIAALGCSESTSPAAFPGAYSLRSIAGKQLPATAFEFTDGTFYYRSVAVTETVIFLPSGTFSSTGTDNNYYSVTATGEMDPWTDSGTWALDGKTVTMIFKNGGVKKQEWDGGGSMTYADSIAVSDSSPQVHRTWVYSK